MKKQTNAKLRMKLPVALKARIETLAAQSGRTAGQVVSDMARLHLEQRKLLGVPSAA